MPARVLGALGASEVYGVAGIAVNAFNTMFQLAAEDRGRLEPMETALLMPDLLGYWLTGRRVAEVTNASSTGLVDAATRRWSPALLEAMRVHFDVPAARLLPEVVEPGTVLGSIRPDVAPLLTPTGSPTPLVAVASHDTASAVVGTPADSPNFAYISCGTWSLVGLELPEPVLTEPSRAANVTNEAGVDGMIRYLKNVMGLWVLTETLRGWEAQGHAVTLGEALAAAAEIEPLRTVVNIDDASLLPPGDMPARLAVLASASGQPVPQTVGEVARCILDSLALAYRRSVRQVGELAGREIPALHIVGGGVNNAELCQLTADSTGLPVITGPIEGAALGNVLVQARAAGVLPGSLAQLREVVARSTPLTRYSPRLERQEAWAAAETRAHR